MGLAWGATAHATTVKVVEGEVFIGGNDGYDPVLGTAQAKAGDSVMAGEYGVGQIIYENGCVINVRPGTVVSVEAAPPPSCKAADGSTTREPHPEGLATQHILLGTAITGGLGIGIYALSQRSSDAKSASP